MILPVLTKCDFPGEEQLMIVSIRAKGPAARYLFSVLPTTLAWGLKARLQELAVSLLS